MTTIATRGHDGALTIIAQTRHVDIDDDACSICGGSGEFEDEEGFWTDCPDCTAEQDAIRAELDAELDALDDAAAGYRAAGIDPQLATWMARHRQG